MPAVASSVGRGWRGAERLVAGPWAAPLLVLVALGVYALVSLAVPLTAGRDLPRYLLAYEQLFGDVVYPQALLARTPVAPVVAGGLLDLGPVVAEAGAALLYAGSILAWSAAARRFGAAAAFATALALLVYPGYVLLFHRLSSDSVFAAGFAVLALLLVRAVERPTPARFAALGAGIAACVLIRPVAQVLLVLLLVPLLVPAAWGARLRATVALALTAFVPVVAWAAHNGVRLDDYAVARGGGTALPLFRAFVADRIVEPDNGPASRELARAVSRRLLPNEPYRSYGIDLEEFFSSGSSRMHDDLTVLADRTWGWDDDYRQLSRVGREAVLAHPGTYVRGVARDLGRLLLWPLYSAVERGEASSGQASAVTGSSAERTGGLPVPTEGEPIPSSREAPFISTPEGRIREVWTSPSAHRLVFRDPRDARLAARLDERVSELLDGLPDRAGRPGLADRLDSASRWYPRPFMWLLLGLVAIGMRRPRGAAVPLVLAASALLILLTTALAVYAVAEYSVPVTPAFVLVAAVGVLGSTARATP